MKNLMHYLCALGLGFAVVVSGSVQAAASKKKTVHASQTSKSHSTKKSAPTRRKTSKSSGTVSCRAVKLRSGKTRRVCKKGSSDPLLTSPIRGNALSKSAPPSNGREVKVRSAPDRAYAVDGETFFFQGRKYRVAGMQGTVGGDMAKQRLQKALESGSLSIDAQSADEDGASMATVRINGRNLVEQLR